MNRTTSLTTRVKSTLPALLGATLGAALLAAPVQAATIEFETGYGMIFGGGESYEENGYKLVFEDYSGELGSAVGAIIDATDPFSCMDMACPVGNPGQYYGALNDSIIWLSSVTDKAVFKIKSFDASFIGANSDLGSYPTISGLLRIQGWRADGSSLTQDFLLDGPTSGGFDFGSFTSPSLFGNTELVQAAFFGFTCNSGGSCSAFSSNRGQFAIDNITLVPEPATGLMLGLGLLGLAAMRRRQA